MQMDLHLMATTNYVKIQIMINESAPKNAVKYRFIMEKFHSGSAEQ